MYLEKYKLKVDNLLNDYLFSIKDEELGSEFDDQNDDGSMMKSPKEGKSGEDGEEENADEIDPSYS